jgi:catechol 2,3-dioxygenase-like lactoylglutathione lyase family enzyme
MESNKKVVALKAHLALNVRNTEKSIEFYRQMLGIEPSKVRSGYAKFDVHNPPLNLTLNEHPFNEKGALSHLGIQVHSTEDVQTIQDRWMESGLLTRDEMQTSCCYALQDKAWVRDPDGNEWEVFVVLEDNLPETDPCACGDMLVSSEVATQLTESSCCSSTPECVTNETRPAASSCC